MNTLPFHLNIIVGKVAATSQKKSDTKYIPAISIGLSDGLAGFIVYNFSSMFKTQNALSRFNCFSYRVRILVSNHTKGIKTSSTRSARVVINV
jgi:hypothetical protein